MKAKRGEIKIVEEGKDIEGEKGERKKEKNCLEREGTLLAGTN
jgi:hypothetical protein